MSDKSLFMVLGNMLFFYRCYGCSSLLLLLQSDTCGDFLQCFWIEILHKYHNTFYKIALSSPETL